MKFKEPHYTKSGPGRKHRQGKGKGQRPLTLAGSLMKVWAEKRAEVLRKTGDQLRYDQHGAYTQVGSARRKWLAGISAQRGY